MPKSKRSSLDLLTVMNYLEDFCMIKNNQPNKN